MARAYGANASLLAAFETTYGSNPVGDYWKLPFVSTTLGSEQGLIANDLIGLGREPNAPIRDVIKVEGDIVVPVDVRNIGMWLKALLGSATVTGTGTLTHTFISGKSSLPSISLETGCPISRPGLSHPASWSTACRWGSRALVRPMQPWASLPRARPNKR